MTSTIRIRNWLVVMVSICLSSSVVNAAGGPNVLIIYTDDQGSIDANCYGASDLTTPVMDRLAAEGVRFTQMLAPASVCTPSRAGLMTGRIPWRVGLPTNAGTRRDQAGLNPSIMTMSKHFHDNGYRTAHAGKWHLGYTPGTMPNAHGFESSFGHMGGCIDNYSHFYYWGGPNQHDLWRDGIEVWADGVNFGELMVREVKQAIDETDDRPFFIYWAINWPHYPLQGFEKWRKHYSHLPSPRNKYAAFVSSMDEIIGRVIEHLDAAGKSDETIVIVQSDHGHSIEERTFGGGGNPGPYRGHKGSLFEGGLRVPSIIRWSGRLPKGEVRDQLVTGCDWFPTLSQLCGIPVPEDHFLDGKSIVEVIRSENAPSPHPHFFWTARRDTWAVRQGDWKLLGNPQDGRNPGAIGKGDQLFLVNLREDLSETTNVAAKYPEKVAELKQLRDSYTTSITNDLQQLD